MKKFRLCLAAAASALCLLFFAAAPIVATADDICSQTNLTAQQALQCGTNSAGGNSQTPAQATDKVNNVISTVLNILSVGVGVIAVIMIIMGGLRYILSGGSQEKVTSAKNTLLYAVIGLIVVALAQIIVQFVLAKAATPPGTPANSCPTGQIEQNSQCVTPRGL